MASPIPKPAATRQRRNKVSTARTLAVVHDVVAPVLPDLEGGWHEMTAAWWADVWSSPMAPEYDASDLHGLYLLARLVDAAWRAESPTSLTVLMGEMRLQRQCFGLTPIDRRRLQWEIDRGEQAAVKTEQRRTPRPVAKEGEEDPRRLLA